MHIVEPMRNMGRVWFLIAIRLLRKKMPTNETDSDMSHLTVSCATWSLNGVNSGNAISVGLMNTLPPN